MHVSSFGSRFVLHVSLYINKLIYIYMYICSMFETNLWLSGRPLVPQWSACARGHHKPYICVKEETNTHAPRPTWSCQKLGVSCGCCRLVGTVYFVFWSWAGQTKLYILKTCWWGAEKKAWAPSTRQRQHDSKANKETHRTRQRYTNQHVRDTSQLHTNICFLMAWYFPMLSDTK